MTNNVSRKYRNFLGGLAVLVLLASCRNQQVKNPHPNPSGLQDCTYVAPPKDTLKVTKPAEDSLIASVKESASQADLQDAKPAEPQKEKKFYAKGPRRQNWYEMFALKGDVARVRVINENWYTTTYTFNQRGDVISHKSQGVAQDAADLNCGGPRQQLTYKYNNKGKLIEEFEVFDPQVHWGHYKKTKYQYDPKGCLIKKDVRTRRAYDKEVKYETFYGEEHASKYEQEPISVWYDGGEEQVASLVNAGYKNKVVKRKIYDANGNYLGRVNIKFDSRGNVVRFESVDDTGYDGELIKYIITYRQ